MHDAGEENTTDQQSGPDEHGYDPTELAEPCGQCGAEAYKPCRPHCTALG